MCGVRLPLKNSADLRHAAEHRVVAFAGSLWVVVPQKAAECGRRHHPGLGGFMDGIHAIHC